MSGLRALVGDARFGLWFGQDSHYEVNGENIVFFVRNEHGRESIKRHVEGDIAALLEKYKITATPSFEVLPDELAEESREILTRKEYCDASIGTTSR
jgi:chromosomal replication initiation ATPase DnaA